MFEECDMRKTMELVRNGSNRLPFSGPLSPPLFRVSGCPASQVSSSSVTQRGDTSALSSERTPAEYGCIGELEERREYEEYQGIIYLFRHKILYVVAY